LSIRTSTGAVASARTYDDNVATVNVSRSGAWCNQYRAHAENRDDHACASWRTSWTGSARRSCDAFARVNAIVDGGHAHAELYIGIATACSTSSMPPPRSVTHAKVPRFVRCVVDAAAGTARVDGVRPARVRAAWSVLVRRAQGTPLARAFHVTCRRQTRGGTLVTVVPAWGLPVVRAWLLGQCLASSAAARGRAHPSVACRTAANALTRVAAATLPGRVELGPHVFARTLLAFLHVDRRRAKWLGSPTALTFDALVAMARLVPLDGPRAADAWRVFLQQGDRHYWNRTAVAAAVDADVASLAPLVAAARARPRYHRWRLGPPDGHRAVYAAAFALAARGTPHARELARDLVVNMSTHRPRRPPRHVRGRGCPVDGTVGRAPCAHPALAAVVVAAIRGSYVPAPQRYRRASCVPATPVDAVRDDDDAWARLWVARGPTPWSARRTDAAARGARPATGTPA
jgi:hypothetical protein